MALKNLDIKVKESEKTDEKVAPVVLTLPGDKVTRFNEAKRTIADLEETAESLEESLKVTGVAEIINLNCTTYKGALSSVKLCDDSDQMVLVSYTRKYKDVEGPALDKLVTRVNVDRKAEADTRGRKYRPIDVNAVAHYTASIEIDDKVFLDKDGNFSSEIFMAVRKALDRATSQLVADGSLADGTTLYTESQAAKIKESFHTDRWSMFTQKENALVGRVVKNTVTIKPVVD